MFVHTDTTETLQTMLFAMLGHLYMIRVTFAMNPDIFEHIDHKTTVLQRDNNMTRKEIILKKNMNKFHALALKLFCVLGQLHFLSSLSA